MNYDFPVGYVSKFLAIKFLIEILQFTNFHCCFQGPVCEVGKLAYLRQTQRLVWIEITWPHFIAAFQKYYHKTLSGHPQSFSRARVLTETDLILK